MADGSTYPYRTADNNSEVRETGLLTFTDSTNQPQAGTNAITAGTLPNTGAWVSGTAKVNPVARQVTVNVECVFDGTNNAATVAIAISPDNSTFTTVGTPGVSAAINNVGGLTVLSPVALPEGWYIKLTIAAHASVAASIYY